MNKPPLGLIPRFIVDEWRFREVSLAIYRFLSEGRPINEEWLKEYNELANRLEIWKNE